jgi:hypothetical protein
VRRGRIRVRARARARRDTGARVALRDGGSWIGGLAAAWTALALVPLPEALLAVLAPGAIALDRALGRADAFAPLTQDPAATRTAVLALGIGLALVAAARRVAADGVARRRLLQAIVAAASGVALLGIAETASPAADPRRSACRTRAPVRAVRQSQPRASLLVARAPARARARARRATRAGPRRAHPWIAAAAALFVLALLVNGSRGGSLTAVVVVAFAVACSRGRPCG